MRWRVALTNLAGETFYSELADGTTEEYDEVYETITDILAQGPDDGGTIAIRNGKIIRVFPRDEVAYVSIESS